MSDISKIADSIENITKNKLPLYRHPKLYSHYKEYQTYKYINYSLYIKYYQLYAKIECLKKYADNESTYDPVYDAPIIYHCNDDPCEAEAVDDKCVTRDPSSYHEWLNYKHRYSSLRSNGYFYNNLNYIFEIIKGSKSVDEFRLKTAIKCIDEKFVAYTCCYILINPERFLRYDWSTITKASFIKKFGKNGLSSSQLDDYNTYSLLETYYKEIMTKNIEICSFKEFIQVQL